MRLLPLTRGLSLLCVLLVACATPTSGVHEDDEAPEVVSSWEEARADPSCVVPLYDEEGCALWRCSDMVEVEASPSVVLVRGPMPQAMRPPLVANPSRWWGHTLAIPTPRDPVFEIPWHNWKLRDQLTRQKHPLGCMLPPEPLEQHHIFPQQKRLAAWFKLNGIDIHTFTVFLPQSVHRRLHGGGAAGGQWNEAWRRFQDQNPRATPQEIWRFAFELMFLFNLNGPLVPYCQE